MITKFDQYNEGKSSSWDYNKIKKGLISLGWDELENAKLKDLKEGIFKEFEESDDFQQTPIVGEEEYIESMNNWLENIATGGAPDREVTSWAGQKHKMSQNAPPKLKNINLKSFSTELETFVKGLESEDFIYFFDAIVGTMCMYRKSDQKLVSDQEFFVEQGIMSDIEDKKIIWQDDSVFDLLTYLENTEFEDVSSEELIEYYTDKKIIK